MKCREIICVAALAAVHTSSALSQTYLDRIDGNEFLVFTDCAMAVWLAEEFSGPFVASTNGDANGDQAEDEADSECAALLHDSNSWQGEFGSGGGEGSAIGASTAWCSLSTGSGSACSMEALLQLGGSAEAEGFGDFGPYAATGLGISSVAGSDNTLGLQPHAWEILDAQSQPKNVIIRGYVTIALQNGADWDPIIRTNAMEIRSTFINVQYQTGNGWSIEDPQNPGTIIVENGQIAIDEMTV